MRIEVISIIEFDPEREYERIENAFADNKQIQVRLKALLDRFVSGDFEVLSHEVALWDRADLEFLHPQVFDVLKKVRARELTKGTLPTIVEQRKNQSSTAAMLSDCRGLPSPEMAAEYPRFRIL